MIDARLEQLGLNDKEQRFYRAALELGSAPITAVAQRAGVTRTSGYDLLARLAARGMVTERDVAGVRHVVAEDPCVLIGEWDRTRAMLDDLVPELRSLYNGAQFKPRVHYHSGAEGIRRVLWGVLETQSKRIRGILSMGELLEVPGAEEMSRFIAERARREIKLEVLRSRLRETEAMWPSSESELRDLRYAPPGIDLGMTMFLHDDVVSYISSKNENYAFSIESRELAMLNNGIFEVLWRSAAPSDGPSAGAPPDR
ncbi:helix-turn-helix domain-containing protein [Xanthobacter sp. KR7-225]|uniref:TrmB family transcriptional regulator n=1 Tax=Xanthobacter sp. KR7-225 TaxID=3156613 RepID=UPI0032B49E5E